MKKAFTLIELLVVIAIIAILAAILFPVFAQAKLAAKKTTSLSNQKQIMLGLIMYAGDSDDVYPRQDTCIKGNALNPDLNSLPFNPTGAGCAGAGPYYFAQNHYAWQKWIMPYVKSVALFLHPVIQKDPTSWSVNGEIYGGYVLNTAITGELNVYNKPQPYTNFMALRDSWLGGNATAIPSPADAWMVMENGSAVAPFVPVVADGSSGSSAERTVYPQASREWWAHMFYTVPNPAGPGLCGETTTIDNRKVPFGNGFPVAFSDGHVHNVSVGEFLSKTPSPANGDITNESGLPCTYYAYNIESGAPVVSQPWPFWGLQ